MKYEILFPFLILVITVAVLLIIGFVLLFKTRKIIKHWHQTTGIVVGEKEVDADDAGTLFVPIVRFTTLDDTEIQFVEMTSYDLPRYKVEERVKVYYNPQNFHKARVFTTNYKMYYWTGFFLGLGTVFLLMGILLGIMYAVVINLPDEL